MAIITMDDGSTIDTDLAGTANGATPATNGSPLDYREYNPFGTVMTGQGQVAQVGRGNLLENALAYGFGRWVDSRTMPQGYSQQAPTQYVGQRLQYPSNSQQFAQGANGGGGSMLLLVAAGVAALALAK